MALVRVRKGDLEFNVGTAFAEVHGLEVLDESAWHGGRPRPVTRKNGRPRKPKVSVAKKAAEKKAAAESAESASTHNPPSEKE